MGDVYQATDTKLGRTVAVKFLPESFAHDAERVARFDREARVLASLNHPNIAAIYGLENEDDRKFLVMELVPGESLAERIRRAAIPVEEALAIAKQVAEALEAAHETGIIHRDLKPANIKITPDGKVKVLDFGLAKAFETDVSNSNLSNAPTMMSGASMPGMVLGTAAYMSPEQAKGRAVDKRTDIFAFGCVLYQMLTGNPVFDGEDVSEILAHVISREPDWTKLPADLPSRVRDLLRLCLEKNVKNRCSDATNVRLFIELALKEPTAEELSTAPPAVSRRWMSAVAAVLFLTTIIPTAYLVYEHRGAATAQPAAPRAVTYMDITYPPGVEPFWGFILTGFATSPDGRKVAMIGVRAGARRLYVRRFDRPEATEIAGTDGANASAFSPDSAD